MMTPAQVARRKFKSALPRTPQTRILSSLQAIGATFTLLDDFRDLVRTEKPETDPAKTVYAALAYSIADKTYTLTVPEPSKIGPFCDAVASLKKNPLFLGVVFIQVDPDAKKTPLQSVSFAVPFMSGTKVDVWLKQALENAQKREQTKIQKVLEGLR
jgi:hypothetical protein